MIRIRNMHMRGAHGCVALLYHTIGWRLAIRSIRIVAACVLLIVPVLGGALVAISWHWVFWFNVPCALAGSAWAALVLHEITGRSEDREFDLAGTVTFLIGLTGLVLGIS